MRGPFLGGLVPSGVNPLLNYHRNAESFRKVRDDVHGAERARLPSISSSLSFIPTTEKKLTDHTDIIQSSRRNKRAKGAHQNRESCGPLERRWRRKIIPDIFARIFFSSERRTRRDCSLQPYVTLFL